MEYDLRDLEGISNLINSATQMLGPLDGFVHSAGILNVVPLKGIRPNIAIDMYKVRFYLSLMITKEIRKAKNHNKNCSIVLISSIVHKAEILVKQFTQLPKVRWYQWQNLFHWS